MMKKFQNKYRIPTNRLRGYDYGSHGLYYVTICTKNREMYFGDIGESDCTNDGCTEPKIILHPTIIRQTAIDFWMEILLNNRE